MPPGDVVSGATEGGIQQAVLDELRMLLGEVTLQGLRQAARRWNWPLRGTAKADLVDQMFQRLTDEEQMRRIVQALPEKQREALAWLAVMSRETAVIGRIQAAMNASSDSTLSVDDAYQLLASLVGGCLAFSRYNDTYHVPAAYAAWQPSIEAPRLQRVLPPSATRLVTRTDLLQQADTLLTAIDVEQPLIPAPATAFTDRNIRQRQLDYVIPTSLLAPELLIRWGFSLADDQHKARFLLDLLISSGVLQTERITNQRMRLKSGPLRSKWDQASAAARLNLLRGVAFSQSTTGDEVFGSWNELNLALPLIEGFSLRTMHYYSELKPGQVGLITRAMRSNVFRLLANLQLDVWYDLDQLDRLFYHVMRDPFSLGNQMSIYLRWHLDDRPLDTRSIDEQTWRRTYGQVLRAALSGPAYWLQLVELGFENNQLVALRLPKTEVIGVAHTAPPDAMGFAENEYLLIRTTRWMGDLRRLALLIASEAAQRNDVMVFKLAPAALRATLQRGLSVADVTGQFAAAGFPLPDAMIEKLQVWQARAGRHHLYDNLAMIELNDDLLLAEIQAIVHLLGIPVYQASPRCLLLLDPTTLPTLTAELLRRGYTPKVLS